jgi:hypothetical protein
MRRRRLFNFAALASLVLGAVTIALWTRGYSVADRVGLRAGTGTFVEIMYSVYSGRGRLKVYTHIPFERVPRPPRVRWESFPPPPVWVPPPGSGWESPVRFVREGRLGTRTLWSLTVSHWVVAVVASLTPLAWAVRELRRRRRAAAQLCARCGYDLRATPARCPECGSVPECGARAAA